MDVRLRSRSLVLMLSAAILAVVAMGCGFPALVQVAPTPTPVSTAVQARPSPTPEAATPAATPVPTATTAPAPVTPLEDEEAAANAFESQVIAVYEKVGPAVVNITNRAYVYDRFMQVMPQERGSGTGFVYDREGHIITNYHVVEGADELVVTLADGRALEAEVTGTDPSNDLAVLTISGTEDLPEPVVLADSDRLRVGQFVVAIGNPFGLEQTLTTGVISALGRVIQSPEESFIGEAIQTDAAINPGNSGGPLLDLAGRVIGVNSQIISPSGAYSGIGFAVSSNTVRRIVPELIARGYYPHPWLGTYMLSLTPASARIFREAGMEVPVEEGLLVLEAVSGGPADDAGIRGGTRMVTIGRYQIPLGGDIIIAIDDEPITSYQDYTLYLDANTVVGDEVEVTLIRDGAEMTFTVTLEERPQD